MPITGWIMIGVVSGILSGFLNAALYDPGVAPPFLSSNEWGPFEYSILMFLGSIPGFLSGLCIGTMFPSASDRRRAGAASLVGAIAGFGLAWVLSRKWNITVVPSQPASGLALELVGAFIGMVVVASQSSSDEEKPAGLDDF